MLLVFTLPVYLVTSTLPPPRVSTQFGVIEGIREDSTTESFLGIPFARPPVGPQRFRRPEPWTDPLAGLSLHGRITAPTSDDVYLATTPSDMCTQRSHVIVGEAEGTEDCLYLNIHRPAVQAGPPPKYPVLVYLFGGAFISGDSHWGTSLFRDAISVYHGDGLVEEHPVVFVTVNYRVGLLGFLATAAQTAENGGVSGNLGLLDQREALRWVKANIGAFGGDVDRIHLFGQSAGAFSVLFHAVSDISHEETLFQSVGLLSPTGDNSFFYQPKEDAIDMYEKFAIFCGCPETAAPAASVSAAPAASDAIPAEGEDADVMLRGDWEVVGTGSTQMECLRGISGRELTKHWDEWTERVLTYREGMPVVALAVPEWVPKKVTPLLLMAGHGAVVDGHREGLVDFPIRLIEEKRVKGLEKIRLVAGVTSDEGSLFTVGLARMIPGVSFLETSIGAREGLVDVAIDWTFSPAQRSKIKAFYSQYTYPSPKEKISRVLSDLIFACPTLNLLNAWPNDNKYLYLFDVKLPTVHPLLGVPHGLDIPFVLRRDKILWYLAGGWYFQQAKRVSQLFSRSFVDLATHGRARWPAWTVRDVDEPATHIPQLYAKFTLEQGGTIEEYGEIDPVSLALPSERVCHFWKHDVGILDWLDLLSSRTSTRVLE